MVDLARLPTARERILEELKETGKALCDDCLSDKLGIRPRQTVYQRAAELQKLGRTHRERSNCASCDRYKLVNWIGDQQTPTRGKDASPFVKSEREEGAKRVTPSEPALASPWFWEGNVQSRIATYLASKGHQIRSMADTAKRTQGKDIETVTPDGKKLYVSVKGWPEKSENTQARHWFSEALFDMILYRDQDPEARLAIGLPAGFSTYANLWSRIGWFRKMLPLQVFWVNEQNIVSEAS